MTATDTDAEAPPEERTGRRLTLARGIELLALVPLIAAVIDVARAPQLQMLDYWSVLLRITNADGSPNPLGVFSLQNEHPLMLPSVTYWLDAQLFAGDQRMLGYLVIVVGAATVLVLRSALPTTLPPVLRASLVFAASLLVFSLHGLHNYVRAMSGIAWLGANLIVVVALLLALRGKWLPAWLVGALACMTYGTAFAVWPTFAVVATMRKDPRWRRLLPLAIGIVVVAAWLALRPSTPGVDPVDPQWWPVVDLGALAFTLLAVIGHLWTDGTPATAVIAGMVIIVGYAVLATTEQARAKHLRFWWALACFGLLASGMIAAGRVNNGPEAGLFSRYTSLSVLMSLPLIVLGASVVHQVAARHAHKIAIVAAAVGLLGYSLGADAAAIARAQNTWSPTTGVALRLGLDDALGAALASSADLVPRLKAMGHYPFNDDFTLGCGGPELGSELDLGAMRPMPSAADRGADDPAGEVEKIEPGKGDGARVLGWATGGKDDPVACMVLVDGDGVVNGGGASHMGRPDVSVRAGVSPGVGFAVAGHLGDDSRVVAILESGDTWWLPPKPRDGAK